MTMVTSNGHDGNRTGNRWEPPSREPHREPVPIFGYPLVTDLGPGSRPAPLPSGSRIPPLEGEPGTGTRGNDGRLQPLRATAWGGVSPLDILGMATQWPTCPGRTTASHPDLDW